MLLVRIWLDLANIFTARRFFPFSLLSSVFDTKYKVPFVDTDKRKHWKLFAYVPKSQIVTLHCTVTVSKIPQLCQRYSYPTFLMILFYINILRTAQRRQRIRRKWQRLQKQAQSRRQQ